MNLIHLLTFAAAHTEEHKHLTFSGKRDCSPSGITGIESIEAKSSVRNYPSWWKKNSFKEDRQTLNYSENFPGTQGSRFSDTFSTRGIDTGH